MATRKRPIVVDDDVDASSLTSPKRAKRNEYASTSSSVSRFPRTPVAPIASTSWSSSSPSKATRTPLTFPTATPKKTPYTPYPLQPSDSPSNPFGRKRAQRLIRSLPPPSSFSKHVALRFQLVRIPKKSTSKNAVNAMALSHRQGGVHRIARVPLNYTFVHLRCLIAWLFNVPASYASNGLDINHPQEDGSDYLFEVKNKIDIYGPLYKPGQIKAKSGVTLVKLSNVHDPARRWKSKYGFGLGTEDDEDEEDELDEDDETEEEEDTAKDGDDQDWKWVDEEDFTIGHCFPKGLKADIGIIYHHSPTTQIHITVNKNLLPRQRGISNTPFVFGARGYVHLSPAPLPRPLFSKSILNTLSSSPAPTSIHTRNREVAPLPTAFHPRASNTQAVKVKEDIRAASKTRALVKLKSPTPPPRKAMEPAMFKKLKSPPPPPHIAMDEDLTDTDADGEAEGEEDEDEDECDLHEFDTTHPFFYTQGSSPSKPIPLLMDEDENDEEDDEGEGEEEERPEVIYVTDSDEEEEQAQANEEEEEQSVIVISDSEEEETAYHGKASSSLPYHLREDQNRMMDTEKFNDPPYLFAKYLLEYMDPKGYQSMRAAIRKGELDEEEVFTGGVDGCEGDDPFDQDDDDDDVVEVQRKRKEKARLEKEKEQQKRRKIEQEEEEEDEDEDMQPSFHAIEDEEEEDDQEEEEGEETEVQLQIEGDSQESSLGTGSTPSLATNASASSSLPPSSPPRASSPASQYTPYHYSGGAFSLSTSSLPDLLLSSEVILSEHYPNKKYTFTPAPPRARSKRMRIERLEKRLERAKKGEFLRGNDEKGEVKAEEEVDELAGDEGEEMVVEIVAETNANKGTGEVWDPFGDEEEL